MIVLFYLLASCDVCPELLITPEILSFDHLTEFGDTLVASNAGDSLKYLN